MIFGAQGSFSQLTTDNESTFMTFEDYLIQKKINAIQFKQADPATYVDWQRVFVDVHPESFTAQKKFLLNDIRRKYLVR